MRISFTGPWFLVTMLHPRNILHICKSIEAWKPQFYAKVHNENRKLDQNVKLLNVYYIWVIIKNTHLFDSFRKIYLSNFSILHLFIIIMSYCTVINNTYFNIYVFSSGV